MSSASAARPTAPVAHCTTRVANRMLLVGLSGSAVSEFVQPTSCRFSTTRVYVVRADAVGRSGHMAEPATVEELEQSIRDAQDKFNAGMGADGDASPYPLLKELRAQSPVHAG